MLENEKSRSFIFNIFLIIFFITLIFSIYYDAENGFVLSSFMIFIMFIDKKTILKKFTFSSIVIIFTILVLILSNIVDSIEITTHYTEKAIFILFFILFICALSLYREKITKFQAFSIIAILMIVEILLFSIGEYTFMYGLLFIWFVGILFFEPIKKSLVKYIKK